jgi:hypothetical protein
MGARSCVCRASSAIVDGNEEMSKTVSSESREEAAHGASRVASLVVHRTSRVASRAAHRTVRGRRQGERTGRCASSSLVRVQDVAGHRGLRRGGRAELPHQRAGGTAHGASRGGYLGQCRHRAGFCDGPRRTTSCGLRQWILSSCLFLVVCCMCGYCWVLYTPSIGV